MFKIFERFKKAVRNAIPIPWMSNYHTSYVNYSVDYELFLKEAYDNVFFKTALQEIITDFNSVEIGVYRKLEEGKIEKVKSEVQRWIDNPNDNLTKTQFQEYFITWLIIGGGLLLHKSGGVMNKNINIYSPNTFELKKKQSDLSFNGIKIGSTVITGRELENYRVVRSIDPTDDIAGKGMQFRSRLKHIARPTDLTNYGLEHMNTQLANAGGRKGVISHNMKWKKDKEEEEQQNFNKQFGVGGNRIAFIRGEMNYIPMDSTPQELDWLNGMVFAREVICSALGVPPQLLFTTQSSTYNNVKEMKKKIYEDTVIPLLKEYCEQMTMFFKGELGDLVITFDKSSIKALQEDNTSQMKTVREALDGLGSVNELREIFSKQFGYDMPRKDGEAYDAIFIDQNKVNIEELLEPIEVPGEGE